MKKIFLISLFIAVFMGCSEKNSDEISEEIKPYGEGEIVVLKGVEGGERKLKRLKHGFELIGGEKKILMIDFFGTFCPPCQKEASSLTYLQIRYSDNFSLIGLTYFEDVKDDYVVESFSQKYGAHYFISNNELTNKRIAKTIKNDIEYEHVIQLPFKVVLKNGSYEVLSDVWEGKSDTKFYIGDVGVKTIESDLKKLLK